MTTHKIFTAFAFPRALPLRLGESTFTVPPPIPKTIPKKALCKLYIYRKGEAFWAPFCVLFPSVEKRPRKVGGISSSPTKFLMPDPCAISSS